MSRSIGSRSLSWPRIIAVALLMISTAVAKPGQTAETEADLPGTIRTVAYRASVFSFQDSGTVLWLPGPDGIMRLEIRRGRAGHDALTPLLAQSGAGWTAILGGQNPGTLNAWQEQWRQPPAGLAQAARLVNEALTAGPTLSVDRKTRWRAGAHRLNGRTHGIDSLNPVSAEASSGPAFRQVVAARGWGRGGLGDVLALRWETGAEGQASHLVVRSTRRPGRLELTPLATYDVIYAMPEAFVPLWPLAQLLTLTP